MWLPLQKRTSKDKVSGDVYLGLRCIDLEEKALQKQRKQQQVLENQQPPQHDLRINTPAQPIDPKLDALSTSENQPIIAPPTVEDPSDMDIEDVDIEGEGIHDGLRQGQVAPVFLRAKNKKGKNVSVRPDEVEATAHCPDGKTIDLKATSSELEVIQVDFEPDRPGNYLIELKVRGKPCKYSPYPVTVHPLPVPKEAVAYGDCLYDPEQGVKPKKPVLVKKPNEFHVQAKDEYGNDIFDGGDVVTCELETDEPIELGELKDNKNGTYTIPFVPKKSGVHPVKVLFNGEPVSNSPVHLLIENETDPSRTVVADLSTTIRCDIPQTFTLTTFDSAGEKKQRGGDDIEIYLQADNGELVTAFVSDNDSGTYDVTYTCTIPGKYKLKSKLNDKPILANVTITALPNVKPSMCTVFGNELSGGDLLSYEGLPLKFHVQARDQRGVIVKCGGEKIRGEVTYFQNMEKKYGVTMELSNLVVTDNYDGTYTTNYVPDQPGVYQFDLYMNDELLPFCPFDMIVSEGIFPSNSIAYGPGLERGFVKTPTVFFVEARDSNGNRVQDKKQTFEVVIKDPNGEELEVTALNPEENGVYPYRYTPKRAGPHKVDIAHKGRPIKDSPFNVPVKDDMYAPDPKKCEVCKVQKRGFVHQPMNFDVKLKTKDGKPVRVNGGDVNIKIIPVGPNADKCPPHKVKVTEKPNGVQNCEWTPLVPGPFNIDVKVNGVPINGSPVKDIRVLPPGPLLAKITERSFQVQVFDDQGQKYIDMEQEEIDSVQIKFIDEHTSELSENVKSNLTYLGEGKFLVKYLVEKPGNYLMKLIVEGELVGQSRYECENFEYNAEDDAE